MEIMIDEGVLPDVLRVSVLLVDDDEFMHEMMRLFLANTQYSLVSAMNVQDAIKIIGSDPPDILITDAMMPGESGFSLIEKMKTRPGCADIPVILWTIMEQADGSVMDASGKADILINKPFYRCDMMAGLEKARRMIKPQSITSEVNLRIER
jgi:two-component system alkaline phosphatase synthesis response regulator PhoP